MEVVLGGERIEHQKNSDSSPNVLDQIFGVIVQNDELHKILEYFLSSVNPFKHFLIIS